MRLENRTKPRRKDGENGFLLQKTTNFSAKTANFLTETRQQASSESQVCASDRTVVLPRVDASQQRANDGSTTRRRETKPRSGIGHRSTRIQVKTRMAPVKERNRIRQSRLISALRHEGDQNTGSNRLTDRVQGQQQVNSDLKPGCSPQIGSLVDD